MTRMGSRRRARRQVLGLFVALSLIGCAGQQASSPGTDTADPGSAAPSAPAELSEITIVLPAPVDSKDPYASSGAESVGMWQHVGDPLATATDTEMVGVLACTWENPDPLTWRLHICPEAEWSDGSPVTAEDAVFSIDRMQNDPESRQQGSLEPIVSAAVVDEKTLDLKTETPFASFLTVLDGPIIQSKAYFDRVGKEEAIENPLTSGPYSIVEWLPGQRIVLEKRDDYWGATAQPDVHPTYTSGLAPDRIIYRFLDEPEAQVTALLNGEVDAINFVPPQFVSRIEESGDATVGTVVHERHMFFVMNPINEALANVDVRRAISHAIDVQAIIDGPIGGAARKLNGPIAEGSFSYTEDLPSYPYDPARARELLAQAGYGDGLTINMPCPSGQFLAEKEICDAVAAMLADLGITANPRAVDWTTYGEQYRQAADPQFGFEFFMVPNSQVPGEPAFWDNWLECGDRTAYCNQELADLFEASRSEFDQEKRLEILEEAWRLTMEDAPAIFLWQYLNNYALSNDFKSVGDNPFAGGTLMATRIEVAQP